ncbi:MAG TPA: Gfo/Idh/MocA family oxidoreductase [bacterium]|nr:Gfo/Idh/MocA family oxidoreductase [bacterium]
MKTLKFGILSTASINKYGFLPFIDTVPCVELKAIASRSISTARKYAEKNNIPVAYGSYDELLSDPEIDCVYISLPVSMHKEWSIRAMKAGKHVLCEKPVAANAKQAEEMAECAGETGLVFAEAFHYRYHPLSKKIESIVRSGELGEVTKIYAQFGLALADKNKVQFKPELAGGALLDIGCYPVSFARWIAGCDKVTVDETRVRATSSGVDGTLRAKLIFENGVTARIGGSLIEFMPMSAFIQCSRGSIFVVLPFKPSFQAGPLTIDAYLLITQNGLRIRNIRVPKKITYQCQFEAFCNAVRNGEPMITGPEEAVANMRIIDEIYSKTNIPRLDFDWNAANSDR